MPGQPNNITSGAGDLPVLKSRPRPEQSTRTHWDSPKRQRTMSLSETAWEICGDYAEKIDANRSEVLEIVLRYTRNFDLQLDLIRGKLVEKEQRSRKKA